MKKLHLVFFFVFGMTQNLACSQDFKKGCEIGAVTISVLASVLQAHHDYTFNASLHRAHGKNYLTSKAVSDTYLPIVIAALQLATLARSKSCDGSNCAVLNCVVSVLNIVRIHYAQFLKTANHQDLLVRTIKNQRNAARVIEGHDRFMQQQQNVIQQQQAVNQDSHALVHNAQRLIEPVNGVIVGAPLPSSDFATRRLPTSSSQETLQS